MNTVATITQLLQKEVETVPFHNLFMLHNLPVTGSLLGGTCSDKALHFQKVLAQQGIATRIHSSTINEKRCHRMLTTTVDGQRYFIDVGSGWPSVQLFPADTPVCYEVYGMSFKSEMLGDGMQIHHRAHKTYQLQCTIPLAEQYEAAILAEIDARFADKSIYPFAKSLRFSKVVGGLFHFLKGNRLRTFGQEGMEERHLTAKEVVDLLRTESAVDSALLQLDDICRWLGD